MEAFDPYITSYEDLDVHEIMLRDKPRHEAYFEAIQMNKSAFEGKIVLDVGAGTGILSVFCAQAGAKKVFAVEASKIANIAHEVVKENDLENIIEIFQQKIEDFHLPNGVNHVDILISEWMGFYLLHEGMLDSIIYARDNFLKADGLMFPSSATINVAPCSVPCRFDDWKNVNGVQMNSVAKAIRFQKSQNPEILQVNEEHLLHSGTVMTWLDLKDVTMDDVAELQFKEVIVAERDGQYQGVCVWFDCEFPQGDNDSSMIMDSVVLSTSPKCPITHWKQTVIVLPEVAHEYVDERYPIAFSLQMKRNADNQRRYNIELQLLDAGEIEHALPCDCLLTKCILTKAHLNSLNRTGGI